MSCCIADEGADAGIGAEEEGEYNEDVGGLGDEPGEDEHQADADVDLEDETSRLAEEEVHADLTVAPEAPTVQTGETAHAPTPTATLNSSEAVAHPAVANQAPAHVPSQPPVLNSPPAASGLTLGHTRPAARVRAQVPVLSPLAAATSPPSQPTKVAVIAPPAAVEATAAATAALSPPRPKRERAKIPFILPTKPIRDPATGAAVPAKPTPPAFSGQLRSFGAGAPVMMPPLQMPGAGSSTSGAHPIPHPSAPHTLLQHPTQQAPGQAAPPEGHPLAPAPGLAGRGIRGAVNGRSGPGGRASNRGARGRGSS